MAGLPLEVLVVIAAPFIGSFLATLALRLPAGVPVVFARSRCPACATALGVASLIPVVSWLVQRGRCAACGAGVSAFYPAVELAALAIALWAATLLGGWLLLASAVLGWALLALAIIDHRHLVLPDALTLPLVALGLAVAYAIEPARLGLHAAGALAGFLVFAGLAWLYRRIRGRAGLGLGDAKLLAAAGAWCGPGALAGVVLVACASALAWVLARAAREGGLRAERPIAFGPHLCLGFWIVWLYGPPQLG